MLTVSRDFLKLAEKDDRDLATLFAGPAQILSIALPEINAMAATARALEREFVWPGLDLRVAIRVNLQLVLVAIARLLRRDAQSEFGIRRVDAEIVIRYRELVETGYRTRESVGNLARRLGLTAGRLNAACRAVVRKSALTLLHDRIIEASVSYSTPT